MKGCYFILIPKLNFSAPGITKRFMELDPLKRLRYAMISIF